MDILLGVGSTIAIIAGALFIFFGALGNNSLAFIGGFGLATGGLWVIICQFVNNIYVAFGIAVVTTIGGVMWFFKEGK